MKSGITKLVLLGLLLSVLSLPGMAEKQAAAEEVEYLTKGDAVLLLSATDFVKQKIGALLSWTIGYDISKVNRIKLIPTIDYIKVVPRKVPPDGRTVLEILAAVDDPGGLGNIAGVRADLSTIGQLPNMMLVDTGLFGDEKANDGVYTLQTNVPDRVDPGAKEVPVAVANKKGWLALAKTTLDISKNPVIIETSFSPETAKADGKSVVTMTVKVDNPGREADLKSVTADLSAFGYEEKMFLKKIGSNAYSVRFTVPTSLYAGDYHIRLEATNLAGGKTSGEYLLRINQ